VPTTAPLPRVSRGCKHFLLEAFTLINSGKETRNVRFYRTIRFQVPTKRVCVLRKIYNDYEVSVIRGKHGEIVDCIFFFHVDR